MKYIIRLLINMTSILIIAYFLPSIIVIDGCISEQPPYSFQLNSSCVMDVLVVAFLFGIVNAFIRPILVFFTFPLTVLTLGLFLIVINGMMLVLVTVIVPAFHVNGFSGAILGSILISIVSWILSRSLPS